MLGFHVFLLGFSRFEQMAYARVLKRTVDVEFELLTNESFEETQYFLVKIGPKGTKVTGVDEEWAFATVSDDFGLPGRRSSGKHCIMGETSIPVSPGSVHVIDLTQDSDEEDVPDVPQPPPRPRKRRRVMKNVARGFFVDENQPPPLERGD